ncbi:MAG TPA: DinB family protein [Gemmatimonadaceae bacterium]
MRLVQRELHDRLRTEARANHQRVADLARALDPEQLVRRPQPASWSVAEVLEHLCVVDELSRESVMTLVATAPRDAGAPLREWKSTFIGGLIAGGLEKPRRMGAPKPFRIGTPRNGVVEDFLARDSRFLQAMDDAASLDWRALRLRSAALPRFAPTINLGDSFRINVVHVRRHLGQMERAVQSVRA